LSICWFKAHGLQGEKLVEATFSVELDWNWISISKLNLEGGMTKT